MSIFDYLADTNPVPSAEPNDLLWLACDVSSLMGQMNRIEDGSPEWRKCVGEVIRHRAALARSMPATDLDILMLAFTARQALWIVRNAEQLGTDEAKRRYWGDEAEAALVRMQCLLEQRCGTTTDELDLHFLGGAVSDRGDIRLASDTNR